MLIPSARHTAKDLALWREHEAADLIHGNCLNLQRKVKNSLEAIREFIDRGPCYCSVSWGKDSVVVAGLVIKVDPTIPLCWVRVEPISNPDCILVRDDFLGNHQVNYREIVSYCHRGEGGKRPATGRLESGFRQIGLSRYISGVRSDESSIRKMRCKTHGFSTGNTCAPLAWWTAEDVFGYLAQRGLPVHPAYGCLGGGRWPRNTLRVASLGGCRGDSFGRREWEQEYYGDVIRRLA